jgi:hypothetical protein
VANEARQAILLWTAGGTVTRNITAPAQSKAYFVINKTSSTQSIVIRGAGPTTGVTVLAGTQSLVVWNGVDFVEVASGNVDGPATSTDNAVARFDGTTGKLIQNSVVTIADSTGNMAGVGTLGVGAITTSGALTYGGVTLSNSVTGTGSMVLSTSPTLVTPALGTPSALVGTNITGTAAGLTAGNVTTNANLTGAVTSTGNATLLGSFSSANLAGALTDETGTGSAVFATSPTLVTPALGTPASGVVTNLTGTASININGTVGATTATTGAFTTLAASGDVTLSGGTANGVAYLNGSKVLTSGSALTFDGTTLQNSRNSNSETPLMQVTNSNSGTSAWAGFQSSNGTTVATFGTIGTGYTPYGVLSPNRQFLYSNAALALASESFIAFGAGGGVTEGMRLTSTGLGIGTSSPGAKLDVQDANAQFKLTSTTGTNSVFANLINTGGNLYVGRENSVGTSFGATPYSSVIFSSGAYPLEFFTNNSKRATLDSSGNLGIGTSLPTRKLTVASETAGLPTLGTGSGGLFLSSTNGLYGLYGGVNGSNGDSWLQAMRNDAATSYNIVLNPAGGNLGLGVTPSAWGSGYKAMQIAGYVAFAQRPAGSGDLILSWNAFNTSGNTSGSGYVYKNTGDVASSYEQNGAHRWYVAPSGTAGDAISFTQAMTLDASGNLGIGTTSPLAKLHTSGSGTVSNFITTSDSGGVNLYLQVSGSAANIGSPNGVPLTFTTANTVKATLDTSGNLGLGVTPSAIGGGRYLQFLSTSSVGQQANGTANFMNNAYESGGNSFSYIVSAGAARYNVSAGTHAWYNAPSGTAGDAISFTQAMSLTAAGDLLIGQTSANYNVNGTFITATGGVNSVATSATAALFNRKSTDGAIIDFYRDTSNPGSISVTTSATSYNTSSDYRLKNITGPITTSGAYIDSLNPVEGTWKADGSTFVGLIAHEVQESSRTLVATGEKDGEQMQGMDYSNSELIANLIAEIQSLRARLAAANI